MTLPAAGWFPDPQDAHRLRWWDGHAWGGATRVLPDRPEPVVPVAIAPVGPSFSVEGGTVGTRSWASASSVQRVGVAAVAAVVLAVASVVWNPVGIASTAALVAGVVGVVRPGATGGWRVLARSAAASALVVAVATAAVAASAQFHLF
ncbi:DUF2510 domain-containing protein [Curtobacterium caseinilyticum]|uniref:DUF2510 domain-containing protein n=1 Tax=Curtobacterium caseinilyticum TaxID=3055137 RepID=A0ABT7TVL0_9MICO|nr:DUF2510 domain-containing protein [Curtobacterium caseinilyticum]MDM7892982.1 DUF2510 domain-containing protein [Curtobacterium caseinilyticum]